MRIAIFLILTIISITVYGQGLKNTEWIKVNAIRKDGSKIIDRTHPEQQSLKFYFTRDSILISMNDQYSLKMAYNVKGKTLFFGELETYYIDTLTDAFLIMTQISALETAEDKLNRYTFINSDFLFDYLKQEQQLNVFGDTLVECNNQFSPTCLNSFDNLLYGTRDGKVVDEEARGYMILNTKGQVKDIVFEEGRKKTIRQIKEILESTSGSWVVSPMPKPYNLKIFFKVFYPYVVTTSAYISFHKNWENQSKYLSRSEITEADNRYNRGIKLFNNNEFSKAIIEFEKCIKIDNSYLDAYYNLAFSYQKLGDKEHACFTWNKLSQMEQQEGIRLFNLNCR